MGFLDNILVNKISHIFVSETIVQVDDLGMSKTQKHHDNALQYVMFYHAE